MNAANKGCMNINVLPNDGTFRKLVVCSLALGLIFMVSSVLSLRVDSTRGVSFVWTWSIFPAVAAVLLWNRIFWRRVWEAQNQSKREMKSKLMPHFIGFFALGTACFLAQLRFVNPSELLNIIKGLLFAVSGISGVIALMYFFGRFIKEMDEAAEAARYPETK